MRLVASEPYLAARFHPRTIACPPRTRNVLMPSAIRSLLSAMLVGLFIEPALAEERLHARIDLQIESAKPAFESQAAAISSDMEFLRRVWLDLAGTIASAVEARTFL